MRRALFALAIASAGCHDVVGSDHAPARTAVQIDDAGSPVAGDVHRYGFVWRVHATAITPLLPDTPSAGGLELVGQLDLVVLAHTAETTTLSVELVELTEHRIDSLGHDVLGDGSSLLRHRAIVSIDDQGAADRVWFPPESPSVFRHVMRGLVAHLDLRHASDGTRAVVPTGNGLAEVEYARNDDGALVRRVDAYRRVDAMPDSDHRPWTTDAVAEITPGGRGVPTAIDCRESLRLGGPEDTLRYDGRTEFSLHLVETRTAATTTIPALESWVEHDVQAPPDDGEANREIARRFAEGLTPTDLAIAVRSAGHGLRPPPGFFIRARGLLRGWPETATDLGSMFDEALDSRTRAFVLDLLVSADTPQAQAVIVDVLDREPVAADTAALVQHLALVRRPVPALGRMLLDLHADAEMRGDDRLRQAILHPLGSIAPALAAADPLVGEAAMTVVRASFDAARTPDDRRAALAALGNAAMPGDDERVRAALDDDALEVRAAAVDALRFYADARNDDALFAALADREWMVGAAALAVIEGYRADDVRVDRLADVARDGVYLADHVGQIAGILAKHGIGRPGTTAAFRALRARADDPTERRRLARLSEGS